MHNKVRASRDTARGRNRAPAILVLHLEVVLQGVCGGCFGWAFTPLEPEGLVAECSAFQAWRQRGQGLGLQLKGVAKGTGTKAVQSLNPYPAMQFQTLFVHFFCKMHLDTSMRHYNSLVNELQA